MNEGYNLSLTPTVGTAAYIAGDGVGGILNFGATNGLSGDFYTVDSIHITDKSKSHPALFIEFFKATPASGTYTDSSPLVYGSGDHANSIGVVSILATDWLDFPRVSATASRVSINDLGINLTETGTNLFALIHADSSFSLTNGDLIVNVSGRQL
jgi:hypothetical protein